MDRLSPVDSAFLLAEDEDPAVSLAIASVAILRGPAPSLRELAKLFSDRVPAIPRLRQKVRTVPLDLRPPAWIDDHHFDITRHIHKAVLAPHGDDAALCELVGEIMSERLDRDRPLWDAWLIDGLPDNTWALLIKVHHCMADGVSGSHLYNVLCHGDPQIGPVSPTEAVNAFRSMMLAVAELASSPTAQAHVLGRMVRMPLTFTRRLARTVQGLLSYGSSLLPTARSSLVGPIGSRRSYGIARSSLSTVHSVARVFHVTVNDVVLAAITGAYRTLLLKRGEQPVADAVRSAVPVSVRPDSTEHTLSNQISAMLPMLPVDIEDPVERLAAVHSRLSRLKSGQQSAAGVTMTSMVPDEFFAPVAWIVRLMARLPQRSVVTVTTNVPGPPRPLRLLGREIIEIFPYVPIALRLRTAVSVLTYADNLAFGVTADRDTTPDVDLMAQAIEQEITELVAASHDTASARV
ncbi:wax ester/triacylglycerol synthase family O-acyltransferase [Kibdelosporangium aridum]|uniref:Diacylglycerol O-acyltransferase n=1 Tax=Kibdelosporangium aridum TaxID=2030 RepID=A0A428ZAU8_KIBAR|nr:wax ester/triacylglycerol synthase family O-acyltransferase [Kibdelosporangium aridum]RSM85189.1 wax ester/triacylglycerol synthase family O-acyltransferase [Kibdelosporangium aridum]